MRWVLSIIALLLILTGVVWFLQGINILGGSSMTGQIQWAIAGIAAAIVGIGLLAFANRRRKASPPTSGSRRGS